MILINQVKSDKLTYLLIIFIGLSGGLVIGGAYAAFITMLEIIPRLVQISETYDYNRSYKNAYILGVFIFTIFYFSDLNINLNNLLVVITGLFMGTFTGIFSSALAEVLNVIPVMSKKLKMKDESKYLVYALLFGKVAGSLYYWLIFV